MRTRNPSRFVLAGFMVAAGAMLVSATPAHAQTEIWSATLTVARPASGSDAIGYCRGAANCSAEVAHYGSLSEPAFSLGEAGYTVTSIRWGVAGEDHIHLTLDRPLADADLATLLFHLDDAVLGLAEATVNEPSDHGFTANYTWDGDESPDEGSTLSVSLTRGPAPGRVARACGAAPPAGVRPPPA